MKFSDLIALAKNGYSPKDIKDLLALADPEPEPEPEKPEDPKDNDPKPEDPDPAEPEDKDPPEKQKDDTDYKKLYTDLLTKYQEQNRRRDGSKEEKTDDEKLADLFRGMM